MELHQIYLISFTVSFPLNWWLLIGKSLRNYLQIPTNQFPRHNAYPLRQTNKILIGKENCHCIFYIMCIETCRKFLKRTESINFFSSTEPNSKINNMNSRNYGEEKIVFSITRNYTTWQLGIGPCCPHEIVVAIVNWFKVSDQCK